MVADTVYRIEPHTHIAAACIAGRIFKLPAQEAETAVILYSRKSDRDRAADHIEVNMVIRRLKCIGMHGG